MPIVAADLVPYLSANRPTNDSTTSGGAIDAEVRASFTQFSSAARVALASDGADTRIVTIVGRLSSGVINSEDVTLDGTNEVLSVATYGRVHSVTAASTSGTRTVTVKQGSGGTTRGSIFPDEKGFAITFQRSASASSGVTRYEKVFLKNTHATLTLLAAAVELTADPQDRVRIGLAASVGDSGSVANRLAAPGGVSFVDDNVSQNVPGDQNLDAGEAIGVWVELALESDDPAFLSTYTVQLAGDTIS